MLHWDHNLRFKSLLKQGKLPNPLFPIEVKNINLAIHGSDAGVYNNQGRFVPSKFEEIFAKYARTNPDGLTADEVNELIKRDREPNDPEGWASALAEWRILYSLGKDENGLLKKDVVRGAYDGSLFPKLAIQKEMAIRRNTCKTNIIN